MALRKYKSGIEFALKCILGYYPNRIWNQKELYDELNKYMSKKLSSRQAGHVLNRLQKAVKIERKGYDYILKEM